MTTWDYDILEGNGRQENNLYFNKNKGDIITIGCSFVYGHYIEDEDTLAYKLQESTKRRVYNLGYRGTGIQHVLWQIENTDFFKRDDINPEYVIYVFISDHMRRMYANYLLESSREKYLRYKLKNNKLVPNKWLEKEFLDYIKVFRISKKINDLMYILKSNDTKFDFYKLHIERAKKSLNKKYPNTKFVIVIYNPNLDTHKLPPFRTTRWKELENEGFIIIDFSGPEYEYLEEEEYLSGDGHHPSGKAWDALVPIIKEKLNL